MSFERCLNYILLLIDLSASSFDLKIKYLWNERSQIILPESSNWKNIISSTRIIRDA